MFEVGEVLHLPSHPTMLQVVYVLHSLLRGRYRNGRDSRFETSICQVPTNEEKWKDIDRSSLCITPLGDVRIST